MWAIICAVVLTDAWELPFLICFPCRNVTAVNPSQPLLTGIEQLIDQIRFVSNVARKQMHDEQLREVVARAACAPSAPSIRVRVQSVMAGHGDAQQLACQASSPKKSPSPRMATIVSALLGCYRELHLASSQVKHGIRRFSLPEDGAVRAVF
jgi:hypothetical protein